ncbi:MAG: hypothetical protein HY057_12235 [Rhodospirillales bacterium]|nr:hypothetical protein [Rhodospirillales bacterium]
MTGASRLHLPDRQEIRAIKTRWHAPSGGDLQFHLYIGYMPASSPAAAYDLGRPLSVKLTPSRRASRTGAPLMIFSDDIAQLLSENLEQGRTLGDLREIFNAESLALAVVEQTWVLSTVENADVPPLPNDLRHELERMRAEESR